MDMLLFMPIHCNTPEGQAYRFCEIKHGFITREYCVHVCPEREVKKCLKSRLRLI